MWAQEPRGPGGRPTGSGEGKTTWWRVPERCGHTLGPYRRGGWGFCGCHLGPREECLTMLQKKWKSSPAIVPGKKRVAGAECSRRTAKECMSCLRAMTRGPKQKCQPLHPADGLKHLPSHQCSKSSQGSWPPCAGMGPRSQEELASCSGEFQGQVLPLS